MRFRIDADSHYLDPKVFEFVGENNLGKLPNFDFDSEGRLIKVNYETDPAIITLNPCPPHADNRYPGISNIESRINDFEKLGINFQILNPQEHAMRFSYLVERSLAVDMAQSYNRNILKIFQKYPDKFSGPALLALQDIDWSLKEIQWAKEQGFKSVIVDTDWPDEKYITGWPLVSAPRFEEICAKCEELDILLSIHHAMHNLSFSKLKQFTDYDLHLVYPSKHTTALVGLVTSGILDRHPNLKVLISEGLMRFIHVSHMHLKRIRPDTDIDHYFKNNFWFTIEAEDKENLMTAIKKFGADRFLFATDYPHDDPGGLMKFEDHKLIEELLLTEEEKDLICFGNALKIFEISGISYR
jgi:predicted TIM-barrel fold metal-dependent hydrolase